MSLEFIKPQLATPVDHPPPRAGWIHEVKHDGYRTGLLNERGKPFAAKSVSGMLARSETTTRGSWKR